MQVLAAARQGQSAVAHLTSNHAKLWQLLAAVNVNDAVLKSMHGILLAPSDAAVDAFVKSMHMTLPQLLGNTLLVDQLTAYHFLPNVVIIKGFQPPSMPLITKTGMLAGCTSQCGSVHAQSSQVFTPTLYDTSGCHVRHVLLTTQVQQLHHCVHGSVDEVMH